MSTSLENGNTFRSADAASYLPTEPAMKSGV